MDNEKFVNFSNSELSYKLMTENCNEQFMVNDLQSNEVYDLHSIGTHWENNVNIDASDNAR